MSTSSTNAPLRFPAQTFYVRPPFTMRVAEVSAHVPVEGWISPLMTIRGRFVEPAELRAGEIYAVTIGQRVATAERCVGWRRWLGLCRIWWGSALTMRLAHDAAGAGQLVPSNVSGMR